MTKKCLVGPSNQLSLVLPICNVKNLHFLPKISVLSVSPSFCDHKAVGMVYEFFLCVFHSKCLGKS